KLRRHWQPCPRRIRLCLAAHEVLDDAILERVEADHRKAAAWCKHTQGRAQATRQLPQLFIDVHADGLEGARGRMLAGLTGPHGAGDDCRELAGRADRLVFALFENGAGDASGEAFFSELRDHVADLVATGASEPVGSTRAALRVHAHVERTVVLEA